MSEETKPESAAAIRAMAVQECARAVESADSGYLPELASAIRALSPAPQVTEEWVERRIKEAAGSKFSENSFYEGIVRATLAALGVEVK